MKKLLQVIISLSIPPFAIAMQASFEGGKQTAERFKNNAAKEINKQYLIIRRDLALIKTPYLTHSKEWNKMSTEEL